MLIGYTDIGYLAHTGGIIKISDINSASDGFRSFDVLCTIRLDTATTRRMDALSFCELYNLKVDKDGYLNVKVFRDHRTGIWDSKPIRGSNCKRNTLMQFFLIPSGIGKYNIDCSIYASARLKNDTRPRFEEPFSYRITEIEEGVS